MWQYQVAVPLRVMGDQALQIYNGFTFTKTADSRTIDQILQMFDDFAVVEVSETYKWYMFWRTALCNAPVVVVV